MKWVDHPTKTRKHGGVQIMRDLEPYRNVIDGQVVDGRAAHREFLRRGDGEHSYVEYGNDRPVPERPDLPEPDVQRAWEELGYG